MEFEKLLKIVGNEPLFETGLLLSGDVNPMDVRKQLSRWVTGGRVYKLRRRLYALAPPYRKIVPHPFVVANHLQAESYVSLQSALAFYGMIPEYVPVTMSVTTGRPESLINVFGQYDFRHVQVEWFNTYRQIDLGNEQKAFVATPEKALLDLIYLQVGGDEVRYLDELRLQALDQLDVEQMMQLAAKANKPKLMRAVEIIRRIAAQEKMNYRTL
jgi:predicted transcriptional regulator of viral defense system